MSHDGPRRILFVHHSADLYGASRALLDITTALLARGMEPATVLPEAGPLANELSRAGVAVVIARRLPVLRRDAFRSPAAWLQAPFTSAAAVRELVGQIRDWRAEIVHTNTGVLATPAIAAALARVPHVWHIREIYSDFAAFWPAYSRYIRGTSALVFCASEAARAQFGVEDPALMVFHDNVRVERFTAVNSGEALRLRASLGAGPEDLLIGVVGRLRPTRKGQVHALQAMRLLRDRGVACRLVFVGGHAPGRGVDEATLRAMAHSLCLDDVHFAGEQSDVAPYYAAMDIALVPSVYPEGFGMVAAEAMAAGRPVIASAIGGLVDQIEDGVNGLLVPPANPEAIAAAVTSLTDRARRDDLGSHGRSLVASRFSVDRSVTRLMELYGSIARSGAA